MLQDHKDSPNSHKIIVGSVEQTLFAKNLEVVFEEVIEAAAVMGVEEEALETVEEKQHRENIRLVNKIMINRVKT